MRAVVLVVLSLPLLASCASLLTPNGSAATRWARLERERAYKANPAAAQDKICKNVHVMGSNFPQKICSTKEEWDRFNEEQLKTAEEFDRERRSGNTDSAFEQ
jgi:hypothetical protein